MLIACGSCSKSSTALAASSSPQKTSVRHGIDFQVLTLMKSTGHRACNTGADDEKPNAHALLRTPFPSAGAARHLDTSLHTTNARGRSGVQPACARLCTWRSSRQRGCSTWGSAGTHPDIGERRQDGQRKRGHGVDLGCAPQRTHFQSHIN